MLLGSVFGGDTGGVGCCVVQSAGIVLVGGVLCFLVRFC